MRLLRTSAKCGARGANGLEEFSFGTPAKTLLSFNNEASAIAPAPMPRREKNSIDFCRSRTARLMNTLRAPFVAMIVSSLIDDGEQGAQTRVLITSGDGDDTWGTVGVAENIIEASWQALVDSIEYKLRRDERMGR